MTGLRKLERDFAHADAAAVNGLLAQLGDEDVMARFGLEARLADLQAEIARLDAAGDEPVASAALFFGGRPVLGQRGIESEFAGTVITKFQDIVAKVLAHETGGLGQRGVVANKAASTLHITNIVRGSFGFLLEEAGAQQQMVETPLRAAVDEATRLLEAFGEPDEEEFRTAIETIDERLLATTRDFFNIMRSSGATLRLVSGETDRSFGAEAVERAAERATSTTVQDSEEILRGQLGGVLPDARQFEFRVGEPQGTIRGRIDRGINADALSRYNRDWVNVDAIARVRVKRVRRNDAVVRETYTLTSIEAPDALALNRTT